MEKSGELSEDDAKRDQEKMQKITDKYSDEIDALVNTKTEEITEYRTILGGKQDSNIKCCFLFYLLCCLRSA
jgi:hypothetical protein